MSSGDPAFDAGSPGPQRYRELNNNQRKLAVEMLLSRSTDGRLEWGAISSVAQKMSVTRATISRLWKKASSARSLGVVNSPEINSRKKMRGRKPMYSSPEFRKELKKLPLQKRRLLRKISVNLKISLGTVSRFLHNGTMQAHTSALKPTLSEENKVSRIYYALEMRDPNNIRKFKDMMEYIHVDEKWFYLSKDKERYYLAYGEDIPYRHVKHKSHITKVQFLCAIARPRFDVQKNSWFDGKIGIWPVGDWVPAARSSVNRPRGTMVWKNKNINREVYRVMLIEKLIPAILEKWPTGERDTTIVIQQDGAKSHIKNDDVAFMQALQANGLKAKMTTQPANSPDCNLCDLGFFRAIQAANDEAMATEADLIAAVEKTYRDYPKEEINFTWLTLQSCLNAILECHGGNDYSIPHMNKRGIAQNSNLPLVLDVTPHAMFLTEEENYTSDENYILDSSNDISFESTH
ncbi:hypothetical protein ACA910_012273 [Epithemia clementina (nom. ined.)]